MQKTILAIGAAMGFLSVAFGAFGAHALKTRLSAHMLAVFETGVRYQMYHALALIAVAAAMGDAGGSLFRWAAWLFVGGIVLFSGSLYALALSGMTILGAVTPIGGVLFLAGWVCLGLAALGK